jgi:hypothetical protein
VLDASWAETLAKAVLDVDQVAIARAAGAGAPPLEPRHAARTVR